MLNENCTTVIQNRISWSAIIIGALVGIGLSFLLNLFGISIGLSLVKTNAAGMASFAIGGFVALLIIVFVSMFVAGIAAGYLGRSCCPKQNLGVIYGFSSWCLALILSVFLASHVLHFIANYTDFIANKATVTATQNSSMPAITTVSQNSTTASVVINPQKVTNTSGYASFLVFILFLVGALASCFGGHFGMTCVCNKSYCGKCGCTDSTCRCKHS